MSGSPPRRRSLHPVIPATIAVLVCGGLIALIASMASDDEPEIATPVTTTPSTEPTTTTVPEPTTTTTTTIPPVPLDSVLTGDLDLDTPTTYRTEWALVESQLPAEEVWVVRRPYEVFVDKTRDGERVTGAISARDGIYNYFADRSGWLNVEAGLHQPAFDGRYAGSIPLLTELGYVREVGRDEVVGRACTSYLTGGPLSTRPARLGDAEVEFCIDDAGLLLREHWTSDGNVVIDRVATSVETGIDVSDETFVPDAEAEGKEEFEALLQGRSLPLSEGTEDLIDYDLVVPEGWTLDDAYQRADPAAGQSGGPTTAVKYFSNGLALVEVRQVFHGQTTTIADDIGVPVIVDGWDEAWLTGDYHSLRLRLRADEASHVEIVAQTQADLRTFLAATTRREPDAAGG